MPEVNVVYWNVESFGDAGNRRGNYVPLCNLIAQVVQNVDADILCLMEFRGNSAQRRARIDSLLAALSNAYNAAGQVCDWFMDWVPGSLVFDQFVNPDYDPNNVAFTGNGRLEGYAVFWKQNISKFAIQPADPITIAEAQPTALPAPPGPAVVANTQSNGVKGEAALPLGGINAIGGDVNVPAGVGSFTLPVGTTIPAPGILDNAGALVAGGGAGVLGAALDLDAGHVVPPGTTIGAGGMVMNQLLLGRNPIAIPAGFVTTNSLTIPAGGSLYLPNHVMALVLSGRVLDNMGNIANYNPGAGPPVNNWELLNIPATNGALFWNGGRRPAYFTILINNNQGLQNRLIPITVVHTPLAGAADGMERCAISRQASEAYDHVAGNYIRNSRALMGGDLNVRLDAGSQEYTRFTGALGGPAGQNGGAAFSNGVVPGIRVNQAAPGVAPVFPVPGMPLVPADNPNNKTAVQLRDPIIGGNHVLSNDTNHFRRSAIDNIFHRGFTAAQSPRNEFFATLVPAVKQQFQADVYDLLKAVTRDIPAGAVAAGPGAPNDNFFLPAAIVQAFQNLPIWPMGGFGAGAGVGAVNFNSVENPAELLNDLVAGMFQPVGGLFGDPVGLKGPYAGPGFANVNAERRAAEFIKLFVSDHLPVIFKMNV